MTAHPFEYALLRVVPRVDRGESINAGVLLYSQHFGFLGARIHLDADRLRAVDPTADPGGIDRALRSYATICSADPDAGPAGAEKIGSRFRWLTAPRSTVIQPGPVHTGLTLDPLAEIERLLRALVLPITG